MKHWLAVAAVLLATAAAARADDDPLKVCLDENLPPLSLHQRGKPDSGFDVALAQAVAGRLGRPLKIQWFESKLDESSSPALEANALLSDGRCALVGSYAFTRDAKTATKLSDSIAAGMLTINHFGIALPETPFGGIKDSGYGHEGGIEGLSAYLQTKFVSHLA